MSEVKPVVRLARPDEFGKVRRLWYELYVVQRGVLGNVADHERRELDDPLLGRGHLMGAWIGEELIGTFLVTLGCETPLPRSYVDFYGLADLSNYPDAVGILTRFMVRSELRGTGLAMDLLRASFPIAWRAGIRSCVFDTNPPLDRLFERLGARHLGPPRRHPDFGDVVVMELPVCGNEAIYSQRGHPFSAVLAQLEATACG